MVDLVCAGLSNRRIRDALFISVATVKSHIYHVYRKLGLASRWELIRRFGLPPDIVAGRAAVTVGRTGDAQRATSCYIAGTARRR